MKINPVVLEIIPDYLKGSDLERDDKKTAISILQLCGAFLKFPVKNSITQAPSWGSLSLDW